MHCPVMQLLFHNIAHRRIKMQHHRLSQEMQEVAMASLIQRRPRIKASRSLPAIAIKQPLRPRVREQEGPSRVRVIRNCCHKRWMLLCGMKGLVHEISKAVALCELSYWYSYCMLTQLYFKECTIYHAHPRTLYTPSWIPGCHNSSIYNNNDVIAYYMVMWHYLPTANVYVSVGSPKW